MSLFYEPLGAGYRSLVVATASGVGDRPVSVTDAKTHLRVTGTDDDEYVGALIDAATAWCEDYCDRTFADKQYTVAFDLFVANRIELPRPPVRLNATASSATVTISYADTGGTTQTLSWAQSGTQDFRLDRSHTPALVYPLYSQVWPSTRVDDNAVTITYLAGYGGAANVPTQAIHAIKLLVGDYYLNREAGAASRETMTAVHRLLANLRWRHYA